MSQNSLLHKIGGGPHGKYARQEYVKKHTRVFLFDWNERRRQMREQERNAGQAVSPSNILTPSNVLSPAFDLGFDGSNSQCALDVAQSNEDDMYL